jgi:hypothetical protein
MTPVRLWESFAFENGWNVRFGSSTGIGADALDISVSKTKMN